MRAVEQKEEAWKFPPVWHVSFKVWLLIFLHIYQSVVYFVLGASLQSDAEL